MAAPREPNTPPLPGSPSGDKENKDGGMSWAGQLWKQYDPINKIIFPGVGSKPTYNERGTELRNEAPKLRGRRRPRSPRVSNASPLPAPRRPIQQIRRSTFSAVFRRLKTHLRTITRASKTHVSSVTRRDALGFFLESPSPFRDIFFMAHIFTRDSTHARPLRPGAQANLSWASCRSATSSTRR